MNNCTHITTKKVKCCGSDKHREISWCKKLNRPVDKRICSDCNGQGWIDKAEKIAKGYAELGVDAMMPARIKSKRAAKRAFVKKRLNACKQCPHHTFLKIQQYNQWIRNNGGYAKFVLEMDSLDQWPDLPDCKDPANGRMFCKKCKCFLEAKANVKNEKCPVDHTDWQINE